MNEKIWGEWRSSLLRMMVCVVYVLSIWVLFMLRLIRPGDVVRINGERFVVVDVNPYAIEVKLEDSHD